MAIWVGVCCLSDFEEEIWLRGEKEISGPGVFLSRAGDGKFFATAAGQEQRHREDLLINVFLLVHTSCISLSTRKKNSG